MDAIGRLKLLTDQMHLEPAEDTRPGCFTPKQKNVVFVHPAKLPNGQSIKLLKTLLDTLSIR